MLEDLKAAYEAASASDDMTLKLSFIKRLLACQSTECVEFHVELAEAKERTQFTNMIRFALPKRGACIIPQLQTYAEDDSTIARQAVAIQALGNLRDAPSIPIMESKLASRASEVRHACIIALGWLGGLREARTLVRHYRMETEALLRGYCATALRQIFLKDKSLRDQLLQQISRDFLSEGTEDARRCIVLATQTIADISLGLRESTKTGKVTGNVDKAWERLLAYFAT